MMPDIYQQNSYYKNLARKLVLIIILVSLTPMIMVSAIILNQFSTSYQRKIHAHLEVLMRKHRQNIDNFLTEKLSDIRFLASCFTFEELGKDSFLQEKLASLRQEFGLVFEDLGVIDERGIQIAYAGPYKLEKAHYSEADWFKKAVQNKYFISDVFLGLRGLPPVRLSATEMQQVLLNLINNAIDAMYKKGGHIDITTRKDDDDVLLTVADEGPGIPSVNLNRIFDPFFTTKPVGKVTGLGFSICYGIVRKAGGDIEVSSVMDSGTRFTVRLPIKIS